MQAKVTSAHSSQTFVLGSAPLSQMRDQVGEKAGPMRNNPRADTELPDKRQILTTARRGRNLGCRVRRFCTVAR